MNLKQARANIFLLFFAVFVFMVLFLSYYWNNANLKQYFKNHIEFSSNGLRRFFYYSCTGWWKGHYTKDRIDDKISFSKNTDKIFNRDAFSVRWIGAFYVKKGGEYNFYLKSDDCGLILIDREVVIDNSGIHPAKEVSSDKILLSKGLHYICVYYFQHLGEAEVKFSWESQDAGQRRSDVLGEAFYPVNLRFNIKKDELALDKTLGANTSRNRICIGFILIVAILLLCYLYADYEMTANIGRIFDIFIVIDLVVMAILAIQIGVDYGLTIFLTKTKTTRILVPLYVLLMLIGLKILSNSKIVKSHIEKIQKIMFLKWFNIKMITNRVLSFLILIDLIVLFAVILRGGVDLGVSVLGIKLKVMEISRPVYFLCLLLIVKIIIISWTRLLRAMGPVKLRGDLSNINKMADRLDVFLKHITYLLVAVIIIFGICLRVSHFTAKSMWWDEALVLIVGRRGFIDIVRNLHYDQHQPLYYFVVRIFSFFSDSDAVRKLPSLLSAIITLPVFFGITRKLCGNKVALVATYILSISAFHITYSQMLRMYTMVTLFAFLSTYMLYKFLESMAETKYIWGYAIFTSLALHTQIVAGYVLMGQMCYLLYVTIESFMIRTLNDRLKYSIYKKVILTIITFIIFYLLISSSGGLFSEVLGKGMPLMQSKITLVYTIIIFFIGSVLFSLVYVLIAPKEKGFMNILVFRKGIIMLLLLIAISPIFIYCVSGTFLVYSRSDNAPQHWNVVSIRNLLNMFIINLTGTHGYVNVKILWLTIQKEVLFTKVLFPLGIIISFLKGKRWTLLFAFHSFSFYFAMLFFGYSDHTTSLNDRHFLLTLPPIIIFVSAGLVWGLEAVFKVCLNAISFIVKSIRSSSILLGINEEKCNEGNN